MDRIKNPFTPGAGYLPPELAGRNQVIDDGQVVAMRTKLQRAERGLMLVVGDGCIYGADVRRIYEAQV